jgi:hypothetical protein
LGFRYGAPIIKQGDITMHLLLQRLHHPNPSVQQSALLEIERTGKGEEATCLAVASKLSATEQETREMAAHTLYVLQCNYSVILPVLKIATLDVSPNVREDIVRLLELYTLCPETYYIVLPLLQDPVLRIQLRAAQVVWSITQDLSAIQEIIERGFESDDIHNVIITCQLLSRIGSPGIGYTDIVRRLLHHHDAVLRANALSALSLITPDEKLLLTVLHEMREDREPFVRYVAQSIIKKKK